MDREHRVYIITSPSKKKYVGITIRDVSERVFEHSQADSLIGRAIRKYGNEMRVDVVGKFKTPEEAAEREKSLIERLGTMHPGGYNLTSGGETQLSMGTCNGKKLSPQTRRKISKGNKGKKVSEETRRKMSESAKGRRHSVETRKKMSDARKRMNVEKKSQSKETRRKIGKANRGSKRSEETKQKMREARLKYWADRKAEEVLNMEETQ